MITQKAISILAAGLATLAVSGFVAKGFTGQGSTILGAPDSELDSPLEQEWILQADSRIRANVSFDLQGKSITLDWVYSNQAEGNHKNQARNKQVVATAFWPTSVAVLSPSKVLVAGRNGAGTTGIQVWTIQPPSAMVPGGGTSIELVLKPIASKDLVFSTDTPGMKDIAWMLPRYDAEGSTSDSVYVQFWDSKEIYFIDLLSGDAEIQASPLSGNAPLVLPELDQEFNLFSYGMHATQGYVLFLKRKEALSPSVVIQDSDTDGDLDFVSILTVQLAASTGLLDATQFIEY